MVFEQLDLLRVLQLEGLEIVKQSLHVMAALLGHTYAALPNLCYHLLVGTHDRLFPHQLQWRYQHWHVQSQYGIDPSNVAGFRPTRHYWLRPSNGDDERPTKFVSIHAGQRLRDPSVARSRN